MTSIIKGYYRLSKNDNILQPYHWVLVAPNHETILTSENYSSKQMALSGIESSRANSPYDSNYQRKQALNGHYMFNLLSGNYQIIGTSQMYLSMQSRDNGIEAVKKYGRDAVLVDNT